MFELRRLDVWPVDDFGVRRGYLLAWGLGPPPTAKELTLLVFRSVSDYLGRRPEILAALLAMPEPGTRHPGALASLWPRVGVPRQARGTFARAVPCLIAVWALSGLYLSLGPSLAAQVTGSPDLLWGGLTLPVRLDRVLEEHAPCHGFRDSHHEAGGGQ